MAIWNPWHGCHKISPGCANCYVYRRDESIGKDASVVSKTGDFDLPLKKNRHGEYKIKADDGIVFTCMTSDFFLDDADSWRQDCWDMIRERSDLQFHIITKRIDRFADCIPPDWGMGWDNVTVCCTCENQEMADYRLPIFLRLPIKHRSVISEPMLGELNIEKYLATGLIGHVSCGGESGDRARPCDFRWIKEVRRECIRCGIPFTFRQTGAVFIKDGKVYHLERRLHISQAEKSGYSYVPGRGSADAIRYKLPDRNELFKELSRSEFRSRFHLTKKDRDYISEKGMDTIRAHADDFVLKRLSAENPENDGKQTPMKGHPVFVAQHAAACCCRSCLEKWHNIPAGKVLTKAEQAYITDVLMDWINREMNN
jgi:protein gp37